jgi:hypothetical protein
MAADDAYAFDITLHGLSADAAAGLRAGPAHDDAWGTWSTLDVPRDQLAVPMAIGFDEALSRLGKLERLYVEPDGSLVWTSQREGLGWQVDGNLFEKDGRVLLVDLKGSCPAVEFDRLLAGFGWPGQGVMMQLVRPAVFLDESTFRRHAHARWIAGDGETLRPR